MYLAVRLFGFDLDRIDSLNTISALLHDPTASNRDIGIPQHLEAGCREVGIEKEIESPNFVRTVVRAIPSADTAVVHHVIQALNTVRSRSHWANQFAGRI